MSKYILSLDQGTTSSRAILFDLSGKVCAVSQYPFEQIYPEPGWVEHNPDRIVETEFKAAADVLREVGAVCGDVAAVGITNQRETVVLWDRRTGEAVCPAIVWQCRRSAPMCERIKSDGTLVSKIVRRTGLLPDAYFSATKIRWALDNVPAAAALAKEGNLACGTIDSWLIWNLSGGKAHVTDYSNASRTMVFDITKLIWEEELCREFGIPVEILPTPVAGCGEAARIAANIPGLEALAGVPITGIAGDQAAALFGQCCYERGMAKNTYGTGCFTLMNAGSAPAISSHGLLTSVAWSVGGKVTYALEGSAFNAGAAIQWLRDEVGLIRSASECDRLAESVPDAGDVYFVPAFTGLGAPYWDMYARGTLCGLTRGSGRAQIARAVLESIAYQVTDLVETMQLDTGIVLSELRVDGGASVSNVLMQFQADMIGKRVERPAMTETTAAGAAYLAGLGAGIWTDTAEIEKLRTTERIFEPQMPSEKRFGYYNGWKEAVERSRR